MTSHEPRFPPHHKPVYVGYRAQPRGGALTFTRLRPNEMVPGLGTSRWRGRVLARFGSTGETGLRRWVFDIVRGRPEYSIPFVDFDLGDDLMTVLWGYVTESGRYGRYTDYLYLGDGQDELVTPTEFHMVVMEVVCPDTLDGWLWYCSEHQDHGCAATDNGASFAAAVHMMATGEDDVCDVLVWQRTEVERVSDGSI